jgi:hypothetical protein
MDLDSLGNIGEFVGAIGVVVSVVYLAIQIRQNTKSLVAQTAQTIMSQAVSTSMDTAANEGLIGILVKLRDGHPLGPFEVMQYSIWMEAVITNYSQIFYEHEHGNIDEDLYLSARRRLAKILSEPGAADWWQDWRGDFTEEFQSAVDRIIDDAA